MANHLTTEDVFAGDQPMTKLIEELESIFPTFLPAPTNNIADIMYRSGQRSVVEYITQKVESNVPLP